VENNEKRVIKNKWKTEKGYSSKPQGGKTFKEIADILTEETGKHVPQTTVSNSFRISLIKVANKISSSFDKTIDAELVCRDPDFRDSLRSVMINIDYDSND